MAMFPPAPSGLVDGKVHRFAVRAYFEDTDLSGVVYHANYLRWFERARSDFVRLLGIDQRAVNEAGEGAFAVTELTIRYAAPARLDDELRVTVALRQRGTASMTIAQQAWRGEGTHARLLAEGDIRIGCVDHGTFRPRRIPIEVIQTLA